MYYPELLEVINKTGAKEAIESLDKYLAFLPNRSEKVITPSNIATKLELDFNIVTVIFRYLYDMELFDKVYIAMCPECGREVLVSSQEKLVDKVKEMDYCIKCRSEIKIGCEDIYVGYKILKQPNLDQEDIIRETEKVLGDLNKGNDTSDLENLQKLFDNQSEKPHDFFYKPSKVDREELKELYKKLDLEYENTKGQGDALEGLVCKLFSLCRGMEATPLVRTKTNQIDCTVRNDYCIPLTVYAELGSIFKIECKNEKKKPGNGYYHKLYGAIQTSKSVSEQAIGILVSRKPITSKCKDLATQYFLKDNIIIINFSDKDLKDIIESERNLLDLLQEKIQTVKSNIITSPDKHKLYQT